MEKPIFFSHHAKQQMLLRGAKTEEVIVTINSGGRLDAKKGKYKARYEFLCGETSAQNEQFYQYKRIEAIFADNPDQIVVITVKVYYYN
jgi:Domain of unknown function (DUF4258)